MRLQITVKIRRELQTELGFDPRKIAQEAIIRHLQGLMPELPEKCRTVYIPEQKENPDIENVYTRGSGWIVLCCMLSMYLLPAEEDKLSAYYEQHPSAVIRLWENYLVSLHFRIFPFPVFSSTMNFSLLTPVLVTTECRTGKSFVSVRSGQYPVRFIENLVQKYFVLKKINRYVSTFDGTRWNGEFSFEFLEEPVPVKISPPERFASYDRVNGAIFSFRLRAPAGIMRLGYYAGFGEANHLGYGLADIFEPSRIPDTHFWLIDPKKPSI